MHLGTNGNGKGNGTVGRRKRLLITGSNGFIGKNLCELLRGRYDILAPKRQELDLIDDEAVRQYLRTHPVDVVVHSATTPGHRNAASVPNLAYRNLRMFFNLARNADCFDKILHVGSGAEFDMRYYTPRMREEDFDRHVPVDEHGLSKYVCTKYAEATTERVVVLRPFGVFGKYEDFEIRFPSNAICKALYGRPITIRQNRRFDYLYIDDFAPIIEHFVEHEAKYRSYNITPDETVELKQIAEMVRELSGQALDIRIAQPGMGVEYSGDNARLHAEIPGLRFTPMREALARLYAWYAKQKHTIPEAALLVDK
jgi:GDP-L-fucose synthase